MTRAYSNFLSVMASTAAEEVSKCLENQITCPVCLGTFDNPHTFVCLHSFCKKCISGLQLSRNNGVKGYKCPKCRNFCAKDMVRSNFLLKELCELSENLAKGRRRLSCVMCDDILMFTAKTASRTCVKCARYQAIRFLSYKTTLANPLQLMHQQRSSDHRQACVLF